MRNSLKKWTAVSVAFILQDVPAILFWHHYVKGQEMQPKELVVLIFLLLYALGFAFLVYKAWGIWESNQVLNRKINALKHLQDHELTGMSNMIRETFGAMGGLTKDLVEFYKVNPPTADFKFDGLQQSINRLMSHMGELHKKERDRLTANFNDNEYH